MDFAVSRFSRLFPAYWAALAITLVAVQFVGLPGQEVSAKEAVINLTMLSAFFGAKEVDGSYWTLQIELFFYAQMLFWCVAGMLHRIKLIVVCWLLLAVLFGIAGRVDFSVSWTLRELLIVRYIPFFAAGIICYRAYVERDYVWESVLMIVACALCTWIVWSWREAVVLVVCTGILWVAIVGKSRILVWKPFILLGFVSYPLYLLHQNIGMIMIAKLEQSGIAAGPSIVLTTVVVVGLASALAVTVERPAMRAIRSAYRTRRSGTGSSSIEGTE